MKRIARSLTVGTMLFGASWSLMVVSLLGPNSGYTCSATLNQLASQEPKFMIAVGLFTLMVVVSMLHKPTAFDVLLAFAFGTCLGHVFWQL